MTILVRSVPKHVRLSLLFASAATVAALMMHMAARMGAELPFHDTALADTLNPWSVVPLPAWMMLALLFGLVLPVAALSLRRVPAEQKRRYAVLAALLVGQIALETSAIGRGAPFASSLIGFVFTSWRIGEYRAILVAEPLPRVVRTGTILGLIFWGANLLFLLLTLVPRLI